MDLANELDLNNNRDLNKELIKASYYLDLNCIKQLTESGADIDCQCNEDTAREIQMAIAEKTHLHFQDSTPLTMFFLQRYLFSMRLSRNRDLVRMYAEDITPQQSGLMGGHDREIAFKLVEYLFSRDAKLETTNILGYDALHYIISIIFIAHGNECDSEKEVYIAERIISKMNLKDLNRKIIGCKSYPGIGLENNVSYSRLDVVLFPDDNGDIYPQQYQIAKTLIKAGVNSNSISKETIDRIDYCLSNGDMCTLDFVVFLLANGLKLDKNRKKLLSNNGMFDFFYKSGVDFGEFFQNIKNHEELIDGLAKIGKCAENKNQKPAFTLWAKYGVNYFIKDKKKEIVDFFFKITEVQDKNIYVVLSNLKSQKQRLESFDSNSLISIFFASVANNLIDNNKSTKALLTEKIGKMLIKPEEELYKVLIKKNSSSKFTNVLAENLAVQEPSASCYSNGEVLIHLAAKNGLLNVVELLIKKGDDINVRNQKGDTPIHLAAYNGYLNIVQLLIKYGADINACNLQNETPKDLAIKNEKSNVIELLTIKGAMSNVSSESLRSNCIIL